MYTQVQLCAGKQPQRLRLRAGFGLSLLQYTPCHSMAEDDPSRNGTACITAQMLLCLLPASSCWLYFPPPPFRLDPQRVRMSSGQRPIGAAKGKQPNTEALCQPPPPPFASPRVPLFTLCRHVQPFISVRVRVRFTSNLTVRQRKRSYPCSPSVSGDARTNRPGLCWRGAGGYRGKPHHYPDISVTDRTK